MTEKEKFNMANDIDFVFAIEDAQAGKSPLQVRPFQSIGDRIRLINELEKNGFKITKEAKI